MTIVTKEDMDFFVQACHKVTDYNLLSCSSGNMSWRCGDQVLVTQSGSWMKELTAEQVVTANLDDGSILNGRKPSLEFRFHRGILQQRPEMNVVLHFQTPCATTLACYQEVENINFFVIPEMMIYLKKIGIVPYYIPGSAELANAVIDSMTENNLAIMKNHGQVIVGKTFDEVIQNAVFFELACRIILNAGDKLSPLSETSIADLQSVFKA